MPGNVHSPTNERRVSGNDIAAGGGSSYQAGTFNLRRRQYLNKAKFNGTDRRVSRAGIAKAEIDT